MKTLQTQYSNYSVGTVVTVEMQRIDMVMATLENLGSSNSTSWMGNTPCKEQVLSETRPKSTQIAVCWAYRTIGSHILNYLTKSSGHITFGVTIRDQLKWTTHAVKYVTSRMARTHGLSFYLFPHQLINCLCDFSFRNWAIH